MEVLSRVGPDRRKSPRRIVNIPASIQMSTSPDTVPIESSDAFISDISYRGARVYATVETTTEQEDLSKMFVRRRTCHVICRLPGSMHTSCLMGTVTWIVPRSLPSGIRMELGISFEEEGSEGLDSVKAFVDARLPGRGRN